MELPPYGPPGHHAALAGWLQGYAATLDVQPTAIVCASAHWETPVFAVSTAARPPMIYDYGGFPEHTYQVHYDAPGQPDVARRVLELLRGAGIDAAADPARGFDHGMFSLFYVMYPEATIPIVPMSILSDYDPEHHLAAGRALAPLRDEGVLIVGSGLGWHNMRTFMNPAFTAASREFDDWLGTATASADGRDDALRGWASAPSGRVAHPREDHLVPLFVAAGAAGDDDGRQVFRGEVLEMMTSAIQFG